MSNPSQSWSGTVTVGASEPAREYSQRSQIPHDVLPELKAELPQSHLPLWGGAEVCFGEDDGARGRRRKIWAWSCSQRETPSGLVVSRACTVVSLQLPSLMGLDACPVFTLLYFARHAFDRADNVAPGQLW